MTAAERTEEIAMIRSLPADLEAAVRDLNPQQLATAYRRDGWTIRQVVHHLADSHMNAFIRMKLVITEDHPTVKPYDQDRWAETDDVGQADIRASLLERLPEETWRRTAHHPERGEISLEQFLDMYAVHGKTHVQQITGLRKAQGW
jgi:hypothetical protein